MPSLISISGLTKTYDGGFTALKGVDLEVSKGEILALLGPNGAGKATTLNAIEGYLVPDAGRVRVLVYNPELVDEADLPNSVLELTDPQYAGLAGGRTRRGSRSALGDEVRIARFG